MFHCLGFNGLNFSEQGLVNGIDQDFSVIKKCEVVMHMAYLVSNATDG